MGFGPRIVIQYCLSYHHGGAGSLLAITVSKSKDHSFLIVWYWYRLLPWKFKIVFNFTKKQGVEIPLLYAFIALKIQMERVPKLSYCGTNFISMPSLNGLPIPAKSTNMLDIYKWCDSCKMFVSLNRSQKVHQYVWKASWPSLVVAWRGS